MDTQDKNQNNQKILIVDDDKFLLDMYTMKFRGEGFDVISVGGGNEAIDALHVGGDTFRAALLDLVMPAMDGFEVLKRIREENLAPSCRIIVLSNLGEPADVEKAKQYRIDGYIIKASSTPSEVVEKVREILGK
ncbi:MAG: response regulator [Parcubacteria group bacterium]|nr:response regulator [Parcubacteria group bacterium]